MRTYLISYAQMLVLRELTWSVAFKQVGEQWSCHLYLLGGRSERLVKTVLGVGT